MKCVISRALLLIFIINSTILFSKNINLHGLKKLSDIKQTKVSDDTDWYIGADDPNEIVTISGKRHVPGNIVIVNNGMLFLDNAQFTIDGEITVLGQGKLSVQGGSFAVVQDYAYQHEMMVFENGYITFENVDFSSSGHGWSVTLIGESRYTMNQSEVHDGFITMVLFEKGAASVTDSQMPGEFLCFGENDISFSGCDFVLIWLVLPENSSMDISLPGDSLLTNWRLSDSLATVSGIDYTVRIDSCTDVQWGLISNPRTNATFSDTDFRVAGLMFTEPDSIVIGNITNASHLVDDRIQVPDRELRFINSTVTTWNFYPTDNAILTVQNSVFGELLSMGNSRAYVINSVCDGSGGYIGAVGNSFLVAFRSLLSCQVISREQAVFVGAHSAFTGPEIDADENSVMALLNTQTYVEPKAHTSAFIFEENVPPVEGTVNSKIPVIGTARIIKGPENPVEFDYYTISYSQQDDSGWRQMGGRYMSPVINDTLAFWKTSGLEPGNYQIRLALFHSYGDSVVTESSARLDAAIHTQVNLITAADQWKLWPNYPNPFNPVTTIRYQILKDTFVTLRIYDMLGREVAVPVNEYQAAGMYSIDFDGNRLESGLYFYQFNAEKFSDIGSMMLVK